MIKETFKSFTVKASLFILGLLLFISSAGAKRDDTSRLPGAFVTPYQAMDGLQSNRFAMSDHSLSDFQVEQHIHDFTRHCDQLDLYTVKDLDNKTCLGLMHLYFGT